MKRAVIDSGFAGEIDWQEDVASREPSASEFLREAAWVVLSSGFRESVVRRVFPQISAAFSHWEDLPRIVQGLEGSRRKALRVFGNRRKIDAIAAITEKVAVEGFNRIKRRLEEEGLVFLRTLPFMGPVTSLHLAKNLGFPVVKPDRHLARIADSAGYGSPEELCHVVGEIVGDPVAVVDVVIWRYVTLRPTFVLRVLDRLAERSTLDPRTRRWRDENDADGDLLGRCGARCP